LLKACRDLLACPYFTQVSREAITTLAMEAATVHAPPDWENPAPPTGVGPSQAAGGLAPGEIPLLPSQMDIDLTKALGNLYQHFDAIKIDRNRDTIDRLDLYTASTNLMLPPDVREGCRLLYEQARHSDITELSKAQVQELYMTAYGNITRGLSGAAASEQ
jgi:hypothetical protein